MNHPTKKGDLFATNQNPTKRWVALAFYGPDGVEFPTLFDAKRHYYEGGILGAICAFLDNDEARIHVRAENDCFAAVRDCFLIN